VKWETKIVGLGEHEKDKGGYGKGEKWKPIVNSFSSMNTA